MRCCTIALALLLTLTGCNTARNAVAPLVGSWEAGPSDASRIGGTVPTPPERVFRAVTLQLRGDQSYTVDWALGEMELRGNGQWSVDRLDRVLYLSGDRVTGGSAVFTVDGPDLVLESRREVPWGRLRVRLRRAD
ncbi:MAG: hypothetical protein ACF8QF_10445 [Phycisphaerales bacterium]